VFSLVGSSRSLCVRAANAEAKAAWMALIAKQIESLNDGLVSLDLSVRCRCTLSASIHRCRVVAAACARASATTSAAFRRVSSRRLQHTAVMQHANVMQHTTVM
jgi:hypothetical protein